MMEPTNNPSAGSAAPPRVLSVEDNGDTRLLLKHLLDPYEVAFATDASEALEVVLEEPFDLYLIDINLGAGKSGTELLDQLRQEEEAPEAPAVAVTAYSMPGDREKLLNEGFDAYVGKPFQREELFQAIEEVLG